MTTSGFHVIIIKEHSSVWKVAFLSNQNDSTQPISSLISALHKYHVTVWGHLVFIQNFKKTKTAKTKFIKFCRLKNEVTNTFLFRNYKRILNSRNPDNLSQSQWSTNNQQEKYRNEDNCINSARRWNNSTCLNRDWIKIPLNLLPSRVGLLASSDMWLPLCLLPFGLQFNKTLRSLSWSS